MNKFDQKKYLFKRRRYGWGWTPVTWQAWVILCVPLILMIGSAFLLLPSENPPISNVMYFLGIAFLLVTLLILVTAKTSPKPKWRWGKKDTDNPDEDF